MGSVCCIASRDSSVTNGPTNEALHRNIRHSPSWNFRWDTRVRVVGDESSLNWTSTGVPRFNQQEIKSGPAVENALVSLEDSPLENSQLPVIQKSLEDSPLENSQLPVIQKSPVAELSAGSVGLPLSDLSIGGNSSEVKQSTESSEVSLPSPMKLSPVLSLSSQSVSPPLASQGHPLPPSSTPSRWPGHSPGHKLQRQVSDSLIPVIKSPTFSISEETSSFALPGWSYESTKGSLGGSSGSWSVPAFPDMMTTSHRERWSSDSETLGFARDKITQSSDRSSGCELDLQTCGICAKLLTEKSSWGTQKIIGTNELAVIAVLICGHVYHAECLENMTPEINKYDPACPVCTYGEKQVFKMSEKALKAELDLRSRKKSKKRIADGDLSGDLLLFDRQKSNGKDGRSQKLSASSSTKRSLGMPFLRRHFSLGGSKGSHSLENHSSRKRGFFWSKSSKH